MCVLRLTLIAILTFIFVGCSSGASEIVPSTTSLTPNIEATIEARVAAKVEARLIEERLTEERIEAEVEARVDKSISQFLQYGEIIKKDVSPANTANTKPATDLSEATVESVDVVSKPAIGSDAPIAEDIGPATQPSESTIIAERDGLRLLDFGIDSTRQEVEAVVENTSAIPKGISVCFNEYDKNGIFINQSFVYADDIPSGRKANFSGWLQNDTSRVELLGLSLTPICTDIIPPVASESSHKAVASDVSCSESDNFIVNGTVTGFPDGSRVIGIIGEEKVVSANVIAGTYELVLDLCSASFENQYMKFQIGGRDAEQQVLVVMGSNISRALTVP